MNTLKHIALRLIRPAAQQGLSDHEIERRILRNAAFLIGAVFAVVTTCAFAFTVPVQVTLSTMLIGLGFAVALVLSRRGHRRIACLATVAPLNTSILINTYLLGPGLFDAAYLLSISLIFLVLEREDAAVLAGAVAFTVAMAIVNAMAPAPAQPLPPDQIATLRSVTVVGTALHLGLVLTHFLYSHRRIIARLHDALDASQAANRAKTRFLANMSHEIRTPMNGMLGMLSILEDTRLDEIQRGYISTARASGHSLLHIIEDILDLSKVESGRLVLESEPFDLRALIEDEAQNAAVEAHEKNIEVVVHYPPDVPEHVIGDAGRVRQVLANLLSNAVKFTKTGQILVTVLSTAPEHDRATFEISVADTGIGIPEDAQYYIFDKFRQVDSSSTRKQGGTGLGLAIVRELVACMGGQVHVDSAVDKGSTFAIELPMALDSGGVDAGPPAAELARLSGARALIVDDHPLSRRVLEEHLESVGIQTRTCATGAEALEVMRAAHRESSAYDLVLVDCRMPEMDGPALSQAVRDSAGDYGEPQVVMLADMNEMADDERVAAVGCTGHLRKPVSRAALLSVLVEVWDKRRDPADAAVPAARPVSELHSARVTLSAKMHKVRVLVVEDNVVNQRVAMHMLTRMGCQADVAGNGREALALVSEVTYDLVLMDIQMPEMDGLAATAAIRGQEDKSGLHTPIVAMTAHAMVEDRQRCLAAGMDGYVSKPIKPSELADILAKYVDAEQRAAQ